MRFAFVESWRHVWPVETICRVMQVSPRGYRSWRTRPISQRARTDMRVLAHIREQYSLSLGSYGRPRMTMELKEVGLDVGERRVGRLMKINGIRPVRTRKHKVTTDSNHRLGVAANWLDGDFVADAPNRKWAGDITYIWTHEGWLYLAVILDLHSRRVVGWAVSDRMKKDLAIRALDMAVRLRHSVVTGAVAVVGKMRAKHWKIRSTKPIMRRACRDRVDDHVLDKRLLSAKLKQSLQIKAPVATISIS